jgi:mannose-6-phosphate isomerase-like protein (cupin superfamily)
MTSSAVVRQPGEGEVLRAGPTVSVVKVAGTSTDDRLGAVEMHLEAGWDGPPAHVHEHVNHLWYVLAGSVLLTIHGHQDLYTRGSCLFVPSGTPHAFGTADNSAAVLLQVDTPQSLDGYFRELVESFPPGVPVDPARIADIMRRHDTHPVT